MILSPRQKRLTTTAVIILLVLVSIVLATNVILGNFIEKKLNRIITEGDAEYYNLSVEKVRTNILLGSILISNIQLKPDSTLLLKARRGTAGNPIVFNINIGELHLIGTNFIDAITAKNININKIKCKSPKFTILKGKTPQLPLKSSKRPESSFNLDSIRIEGISGIDLKRIEFKQSEFTYIDLLTSDTLFVNKSARTEIKDLNLNRLPDHKDLFKLDIAKFSIDINDENMLLPGGDYRLSIKHLSLDCIKDELLVNELKLKPNDPDLYRFAQKLHYTSEMFTIDVRKIHLKITNLPESINNKSIFIDSLNVLGLNLAILMDKSLPFDTEKRPGLPNQLLKNMKTPIYIDNIRIAESNLYYQEKMPEIEEPMTVTLNKLDIKIKRATSIKDSLAVPKDMTIQLQSDFMNKAKLQINFAFPLYQKADTFFYTGSLGPANFTLFNQAAFPALGAKFTDGKLKSIQFKGSANNTINSGEFAMLYNNLQAEISKKDYKTKSKLFSWAANTALQDANPTRNRNTRVILMYSERVPYKGFGNFMWKTLEYGIIKTILPGGKKKKINDNDRKKNKKKKRN